MWPGVSGDQSSRFSTTSIGSAGLETGVTTLAQRTHRRFIELFRREVGLTPRDYFRVKRLQRALTYAAHSGAACARLAHELGFADQSHWIVECRKLTVLTPKALLAAQRAATAIAPGERGQMLDYLVRTRHAKLDE